MGIFRNVAGLAAAGVAMFAMSGTANAGVIGQDTAPDGAKYSLAYTNAANVYTFTFIADFTGASGSDAFGDYVSAISIASLPGNLSWNEGSVVTAPYGSANWSIYEAVVTNSNGCPAEGSNGKDWCLGLNTGYDPSSDPTISNTTVYTWTWTMTLLSGTFPADATGWSYKFVSTTGDTATCTAKGQQYTCWEFGNYQISRTFDGPSVPEPATLGLLGLGLAGIGFGARRRKA